MLKETFSMDPDGLLGAEGTENLTDAVRMMTLYFIKMADALQQQIGSNWSADGQEGLKSSTSSNQYWRLLGNIPAKIQTSLDKESVH